MSRFFSTLLGLFAGITIGGIIGVLFAPEKGIHTRERLSYRLNKASESLRDSLEELIENTASDDPNDSASRRRKAVVSDLENKAEDLLSEVDKLFSQIKREKGA